MIFVHIAAGCFCGWWRRVPIGRALPCVRVNRMTELHNMTAEEWRNLDHRSRTGLYNQYLRDEATIAVLDRAEEKWHDLPPSMQSSVIEQQRNSFGIIFCSTFEQNDSEVIDQLLPRHQAQELELACRRALGEDITLNAVGSITRGTAADEDSDVDLEVRYTGDRANESITHKWDVILSLRELDFVSDLHMGDLAIKFDIPGVWEPTHVDLVLFRQRPEEFPCLRGGPDFCENSARINSVFPTYPAAANAVKGVKTLFKGGRRPKRPKGLLLEAIVWRLSEEVGLTPRASDLGGGVDLHQHVQKESYDFFKLVVRELRNWKTSLYFADDLQKDLENLPFRRRAKYEKGFWRLQDFPQEFVDYRLFERAVMETILDHWTPDRGPFDRYVEMAFDRQIAQAQGLDQV